MTAAQSSQLPSLLRRQHRPPRRHWLRMRQWNHQAGLWAKWWLRTPTPYQPLFVLATYRSGSNLLLDYLNHLQGVKCLAEVLCPTLPYGLARSQQRPQAALAHIRRSLHAHKAPIRGCKLMLDQLSACRLPLDVLDAAFPRAKYIVLYRQSLAEQFLSRQAARVTQQWILVDGQEHKQPRFTIDTESLGSYCTSIRQAYREILHHAWLAQRGVLISYEDLAADPAACLSDKICPLLGVPPTQPKTSLRKQNTLTLEDRVANYREVASVLHSPLCVQHYSFGGNLRHGVRA
jgi:LPS sulfotransferase NodH